MPLISDLLQRLPTVKTSHMSSTGFVLWICWEKELDSIASQVLQDYGGISIAVDRDQALWFFFSSDVFLSLAKLTIWSNFNSLSISIQVFPGKLVLSNHREMSLSIDVNLSIQEILVSSKLEIWVHPKAKEIIGVIPGITYKNATIYQGMSPCNWENIEVDSRLPYVSSQGWYFILRPVGNPLDKAFQTGWKTVYEQLEKIVQTHKLKYYVHDNYLMLTIDNLRVFRLWIHDLLQCFITLKQQDEYWPCICAAIDKKGFNFTKELPLKIGIKWDNLIPDFPYLNYRNAFLLGDGFRITDLNFSSAQMSIDSWCTVSLVEGHTLEEESFSFLIPDVLVGGEGSSCFYCNSKSHSSIQCPSRTIGLTTYNLWQGFSEVPIEGMDEGFQKIEKIFMEEGFLEGYQKIFKKSDTIEYKVLRAVFECTAPVHIRTIRKVWLTTGQNFPLDMDIFPTSTQNVLKEEGVAWGFLDRLMKIEPSELNVLEKEVLLAISKSPGDFRLCTILGFIAVERGDLVHAQAAWKEAESIATLTIHQVWHIFLQARVFEIQTSFPEAIAMYQSVVRLCPAWVESEYRQIVCRIKMGFAEYVQPRIFHFIEQSPIFFNRFFVDPELGRGSLIITHELHRRLIEVKEQAEEEKQKGIKLLLNLEAWFTRENKTISKLYDTLQQAIEKLSLNTYCAFIQMVQIYSGIEKDVSLQIKNETKELKKIFTHYLKKLERIRDEASWFPFPALFVSFNKEFNECASIFNWAVASNFHDPEVFKQARGYLAISKELIERLNQQLRFLCVVRDFSLFMLIFIKAFFWIEAVGLFIGVISVPIVTIFGEELGLSWFANFIREEKWNLQKVIIFIITIISLCIAAVHASLIFSNKKKKLIDQAKEQRERIQEIRLTHIKESMKKKNRDLL